MATIKEDNDQTFLLKLSDTLRTQTSVEAVGNRATQLIAQRLGADRVYLVSLNPDDDTVLVTHETRRQGMLPLQGTYHSSDFPAAIQEIFERTIIYTDVRTDARLTDLDRLSFAGLGAVGFLAASIRRGSQTMIWAAGAVSTQPRSWTPSEVMLFEDAVERTWAALERAQAEESLRQSEEKYRTLFDSIDEGFCIVEVILDENGKPFDLLHLEANSAYERYTGLSGIVGKRSREIIPEAGPWLDFYGQVALTGQAARNESYLIAPIDRWIAASASRIGGEGSRKVAIVFDDITGRKRHEANQQLLVQITDDLSRLTSPDEIMHAVGSRLGHYLKLSNCLFADVDQERETITVHTCWSRGDVPSLKQTFRIADYITPASSAGKLVIIDNTATDERTDADYYARLNIGAFVTIPFYRNNRWVANFGVSDTRPHAWRTDETELLADITARVFPRIERARAEEALQQAARRKDEFLAMLAHELRNPLAPVRNGLQLLAQIHSDDQFLGTMLPIMNRQMDHLLRMVDDLLDVSRISRGKIDLRKERTDLTQVVSQAVEVMRPLYLASGRQLKAQLSDQPLYLAGDPTRLNQVVTNLLTNGLRYTHEGGQVWLTLEQRHKQGVLRVQDNGIGLATDQLEAIFELFVQVDHSLTRSHGGLGVGLSLVQELVQMHGGRVEARSQGLEQGSEFVVYLPILEA